MEYSKNPFTPTFGSVPPFLAGREHILRDINRGFINGPGDPNLSTIFGSSVVSVGEIPA